MAIDPATEEREQSASEERVAQLHRALAEAQDRHYWLDRWQLDLNALMQRRGAGALRGALRVARAAARLANEARIKRETQRAMVTTERSDGHEAIADVPTRSISPDPLAASPVTDVLYARLDPGDVAMVEERMGAAHAALWETADEPTRRRLTLAFAADLNVDSALERTGLSAAMPAPGIHAMARGPAAAGGSTYDADAVVDALAATGTEPESGMKALDFGCSSGRVVRVLAAAYPDVDWHGCDPIPEAIDWASAHLPGIDFRQSPEYPPASYGDESFDFAYAISVWSHFSERAGLDWLRELRRVLRPGGRMVLTVHGPHSIWHDARAGVRPAEQLERVRAALEEAGFFYEPEFAEHGDHGITNPDWGTAFLSPEWLLARITPDWRVLLYRPGHIQDNEDLYVLERR